MTEAGRQSVPLGEAMALSDHRSVTMAMRYFQPGQSTSATAAQLLGPLPPDTDTR